MVHYCYYGVKIYRELSVIFYKKCGVKKKKSGKYLSTKNCLFDPPQNLTTTSLAYYARTHEIESKFIDYSRRYRVVRRNI